MNPIRHGGVASGHSQIAILQRTVLVLAHIPATGDIILPESIAVRLPVQRQTKPITF